ncbi:CHASE domain-containing protein [Actinoplanes sp. NPDC026623]|uniref:CHASE domain-containing protein n=1 Tax=Actinoplanes sp. NPDC026623 TaxID=3155610 RepID=UPI00340E3FF1
MVFCLGTSASRLAERSDERRNAAQLMDRYSSELGRAITTEIQRYGDMLADVAGALGAQGDRLTGADFTWISDQVSRRRLPGAASLELVMDAPDSGGAALQSFWRQHGATGLTLKPTAAGGEHAFVIFTRAFGAKPVAIGGDMYSIPEAAQALRESGHPCRGEHERLGIGRHRNSRIEAGDRAIPPQTLLFYPQTAASPGCQRVRAGRRSPDYGPASGPEVPAP